MSFTNIIDYCNNTHFDDQSYDSEDLCFDNKDDDEDEDPSLFSWDFTDPDTVTEHILESDEDIILLSSLFSRLRIS